MTSSTSTLKLAKALGSRCVVTCWNQNHFDAISLQSVTSMRDLERSWGVGSSLRWISSASVQTGKGQEVGTPDAVHCCKDMQKTIEDQQIAGLVWFGQHCPHMSSLCISGLWVGLDSAWKFCCRLGLIANSKAYWEGMQPATPWELAQSMKRYWEIPCLQCFSARIPTAMSTTCWTPRSYDVFTQNK